MQCVGPFTFSHLINTLQSKNCGFNLILQKKKYRFMETEWLVWQHTKNSSVGQWTEAVCPSSALLPTWCCFSTDFQELSPNRTFPVNLGKEQFKKITVILTKQTRQKQISCNIAYMWNLTNELIYKTEIDPRHRKALALPRQLFPIKLSLSPWLKVFHSWLHCSLLKYAI